MSGLSEFLVATAHAQDAAPTASSPAPSTTVMSFLPLVLILIVFYVLLIRPQQKKFDEQNKMIKALKRGDRVVTAGGIHGKITKILDDADQVMVEIADGVQVKVVRSTISALAAKTEPASESDPKIEKKD